MGDGTLKTGISKPIVTAVDSPPPADTAPDTIEDFNSHPLPDPDALDMLGTDAEDAEEGTNISITVAEIDEDSQPTRDGPSLLSNETLSGYVSSPTSDFDSDQIAIAPSTGFIRDSGHTVNSTDMPALDGSGDAGIDAARYHVPPVPIPLLPPSSDVNIDYEDLPPLEQFKMVGPMEKIHHTSPTPGVTATAVEIQHSKDVKDTNAKRGSCGLRNLGNTCFMNSGLQCLLSNPQLVKFFTQVFQRSDFNKETLTGHFSVLLDKTWCGQYSIVHPASFKEALGMYHQQFQDYRQHDCQEFLALLLDDFHELLNMSCQQNNMKFASKSIEDINQPSTSKSNQVKNNQILDQLPAHSLKQTTDCMDQLGAKSPDQSDVNMDSQSDITETKSVVSQSDCQSDITEPATDQSEVLIDESDRSTTHSQSQSPVESLNQTQSEDSNHSTNSQQSSDSQRNPFEYRLKSIPEELKAFKPSSGLLNKYDMIEKDRKLEKNLISTNASRGIHLMGLEELYMKDTKIKNVNVLATEYMSEIVQTDSEKFAKHDNRLNEEDDLNVNITEEILEPAKREKYVPKKIKMTNLFARQISDDSQKTNNENQYSINNIKRIKIDEEHKNVRLHGKRKVNTAKGLSKEASASCISPATFDQASMQWEGESCSSPDMGLDLAPEGTFLAIKHDQPIGEKHEKEAQAEMDFNVKTGHEVDDDLSLVVEQSVMALNEREADKAWTDYVRSNNSVIVDTFQGQFKSTVVCSECNHVSVTYEPFMYLSVPIPHAMERQIVVTFVPSDCAPPVQYCLTLFKSDYVKKVLVELRKLIGLDESCDLIIAEVLDNHISRIVDENTCLRYLNDYNREIYIFQMLPAPKVDDATTNDDPAETGDMCLNSTNKNMSTNNGTRNEGGDIFSNVGIFSYDDLSNKASNSTMQSTSGAYGGFTAENSAYSSDSWLDAAATWDSAVRQKGNEGNGKPGDAKMTWPGAGDTGVTSDLWPTSSTSQVISTSYWSDSSDLPGTSFWTSGDQGKLSWETSTSGDITAKNDDITENEMWSTSNTDSTKTDDVSASVSNTWNSCAICLEEMADMELMVHGACGGTLCNNCLEMSFKHYGEAAFACPVCSVPVNPSEEFLPLCSLDKYRPKLRILPVPVVYRLDCEDSDEVSLFGHPNILYLPSSVNGQVVYDSVESVVSYLGKYTILFTDGQGLRCSRCLFDKHCSGCEISREDDIQLQPGDNLAVKFTEPQSEQSELANRVLSHKSMEKLRSQEPLTIFDCFKAFTESEVLDEHNPWFCPHCAKNQCAMKTMTVWRYPQTLVVYLKRFVFHDSSSTKVDNKVVFPIEGLDLSDYISGPVRDSLLYDLQGCICHFGGVNAGHYTAYTKHPVTNDWWYYNDEAVTRQQPTESDYNSAYVLFYHRRGSDIDIQFTDTLCSRTVDVTPVPPSKCMALVPVTQAITQEAVSKILADLARDNDEKAKLKTHSQDLTQPTLDFYS